MLSYFTQAFAGDDGFGLGAWIHLILGLVIFLFIAWMFVDALRRGEYIWAVFIFISSGLSAILYFFMVYRASGGGALTGFELPGAADRRQIKRLLADIHHLDKPHHHLQLADIYFSQGKLDQAEASYRAAYERDAEDEDIYGYPRARVQYADLLIKQKDYAEARKLLEEVITDAPFATKFQRKREAVWFSRAKAALRSIPG